MKKSRVFQLIIGFTLMCSIQCNQGTVNVRAKEPLVVHVPHRMWPGCKSAPEMDALFRSLRPGEKVGVKLIFVDPKNSLDTSLKPNIRKGSVYFYTNAGYFRLDNSGKVYSNPDGQNEVELLGVSFHGISIDYNNISNTNASSPTEPKYKIQSIKSEVTNGQYVGHIVIRLSDDFDGDLSGWQSCHGI